MSSHRDIQSPPNGDAGAASEGGGIFGIFRSLKHRNYRLFFFGHGASLVGSWMQGLAVGWLVYKMTNSPFLLGLVAFAGQIPCFFVAPLAGVLADRWDRRRAIITTQILAMVQAALLAALALTGVVRVEHIIILELIRGTIHAFDMPLRHSFVVEMLDDRADLPSAIALSSFMVNGAKLAGPVMAGFLVYHVNRWLKFNYAGEGVVFAINCVTFLTIIAALLAMRISSKHPPLPEKHWLRHLADGMAYIRSNAVIRSTLLMVAVMGLTAMPYATLMPVFARDILGGDSQTLGLLMGASAIGALAGVMLLGSQRNIARLGRMMAAAAAIFGAGIVAFSFSRWLWLSLVLMAATGFGFMIMLSSANTLVQHATDDDKRGRVMSFYTLSFLGTMPVGSMLAGALARHIGSPTTLLLCGLTGIAAAVIFGMTMLKRAPIVAQPQSVGECNVGEIIIPQVQAQPLQHGEDGRGLLGDRQVTQRD